MHHIHSPSLLQFLASPSLFRPPKFLPPYQQIRGHALLKERWQSHNILPRCSSPQRLLIIRVQGHSHTSLASTIFPPHFDVERDNFRRFFDIFLWTCNRDNDLEHLQDHDWVFDNNLHIWQLSVFKFNYLDLHLSSLWKWNFHVFLILFPTFCFLLDSIHPRFVVKKSMSKEEANMRTLISCFQYPYPFWPLLPPCLSLPFSQSFVLFHFIFPPHFTLQHFTLPLNEALALSKKCAIPILVFKTLWAPKILSIFLPKT